MKDNVPVFSSSDLFVFFPAAEIVAFGALNDFKVSSVMESAASLRMVAAKSLLCKFAPWINCNRLVSSSRSMYLLVRDNMIISHYHEIYK